MKIPTLIKWQPIELFWIDSLHTSGWKFEDNLELDDKYLKHMTIGYFFKQTKCALTVVQSKSNDGEEKNNIDAAMTIPLVAIKKIRKIK